MEQDIILSDTDNFRENRMKRLYNCVVAQEISSSGKYLFAATRYGDIFIQSIDDLQDLEKSGPKPMKKYKSTKKMPIKCIKYHPKGFLIVGTNGLIYTLLWLEDKCELINKPAWVFYIPLHHCDSNLPVVNSIWLPANSDCILIACSNCILYEICLQSKSLIRYYNGHTASILNVCSQKEGNDRRIYTASEDGSVRIWSKNEQNSAIVLNPYTHTLLARPKFGKWISAIAVKGEQWLICGGGPKLALWHLNSCHHTNVYNFPSTSNVCEFVDDLVVTGGEQSNLSIYKFNGDKWSDICTENTSIYSVVSTVDPYNFMSIAGFSNSLTILQNDFRYSDASIELYS